jgi:hypothetical protein
MNKAQLFLQRHELVDRRETTKHIQSSIQIWHTCAFFIELVQLVLIMIFNGMGHLILIRDVRTQVLHGGNATFFETTAYGHGLTMVFVGSIHIEWLLATMLFLSLLFRLYSIVCSRHHRKQIESLSNLARWIEYAITWTCMTVTMLAFDINASLSLYIMAVTAVWVSALVVWFQEQWNTALIKRNWSKPRVMYMDPRKNTFWNLFLVSEMAGMISWVHPVVTVLTNMTLLPSYLNGAACLFFLYSHVILSIQFLLLKSGFDDHDIVDTKRRLWYAYNTSGMGILLVNVIFRASFTWLILGSIYSSGM